MTELAGQFHDERRAREAWEKRFAELEAENKRLLEERDEAIKHIRLLRKWCVVDRGSLIEGKVLRESCDFLAPHSRSHC